MVFTFLQLAEHGMPNDMLNRRRVMRDTFVEFLATTLFVCNGTLSATSTQRTLVGSGATAGTRVLVLATRSFLFPI